MTAVDSSIYYAHSKMVLQVCDDNSGDGVVSDLGITFQLTAGNSMIDQLIAAGSSIYFAKIQAMVQVDRVGAFWKLGAACGGVFGFGAWAGVLGHCRP